MKVLEDGSYQMDDGRVVSSEDIVKLYKSAPKSQQAAEAEEKTKSRELSEGQSSGSIRLED